MTEFAKTNLKWYKLVQESAKVTIKRFLWANMPLMVSQITGKYVVLFYSTNLSQKMNP